MATSSAEPPRNPARSRVGTAKGRGSYARHHILWVGLWLGKLSKIVPRLGESCLQS